MDDWLRRWISYMGRLGTSLVNWRMGVFMLVFLVSWGWLLVTSRAGCR